VHQANIANGPQQVNNTNAALTDPARAGKPEIPRDKLLEQQREQWLDAGTPGAAGSSNSSVEAVGAIHGAKDSRG
jgi:hypothetical protein